MRHHLAFSVVPLLLGACAPAQSGPAVRDPVFAPGQEWLSEPASKFDPNSTLYAVTVPARDTWPRSVAVYSRSSEVGSLLSSVTVFQFTPESTYPAFIFFKRVTHLPLTGQALMIGCVVRNPGTVGPGQVLTGLLLSGDRDVNVNELASVQAYLRGGEMESKATCKMKRVS